MGATVLRAVLKLGGWITPLIVIGALAWPFLAGRLRTYAFEGESMEPALAAGDWLVVDLGGAAAVGEIVVATRPDRPELEVIKRVAQRSAEGDCFLLGDNPQQSTDSREWGWLEAGAIHGVVRFRYWPASRAGPIRPRLS
jgi:nickel-type superoxide dismutase maturation protease